MNNELIIKNIDNKIKLLLHSDIFKNSKILSWILEVDNETLKLKLYDSEANPESSEILFKTNQVIKKSENNRIITIPPNIIALYNLNSNSRLKFISNYNFVELIPENDIKKIYRENINENSLALIFHEPIKIKKSGTKSITIPRIVTELFDLKKDEVLNYRLFKKYNQHVLMISKINELIDFPDDEMCFNTISKVYRNQINSVSSSILFNKTITDLLNLNNKEYLYLSFYINYNLTYLLLEE